MSRRRVLLNTIAVILISMKTVRCLKQFSPIILNYKTSKSFNSVSVRLFTQKSRGYHCVAHTHTARTTTIELFPCDYLPFLNANVYRSKNQRLQLSTLFSSSHPNDAEHQRQLLNDNDDSSSKSSSPAEKKTRVSSVLSSSRTDDFSLVQDIGRLQVSSPRAPLPNTRPRKGTKKSLKIEPGSLTPPKNWEQIYSLVTELRSDRSAPVDSFGASSIIQTDRGEVVFRYQVLIALMLSSQTKDATVGETMRKLQQHGLDVDTIRNNTKTSHETLNALIYKVGFRNNKTKYIKEATEILATKYGGDIPSTAEELMTLPGIGPKMAFIIENVALNTTTGIGVDTHMHRIFNALQWVNNTY